MFDLFGNKAAEAQARKDTMIKEANVARDKANQDKIDKELKEYTIKLAEYKKWMEVAPVMLGWIKNNDIYL